MEITRSPLPIGGRVHAMSSKSQAHRLMLCAALADRPTDLFCPDTSADMEATAACLTALGAKLRREGQLLHITPLKECAKHCLLDCGESGSTLRFLLPVVGALGAEATFRLHGRLASRPLSPLWEEMERHGCRLSRPTPDTLRCEGKLSGGCFSIAGNISSQFISGLLFALPLLGGTQDIMLTAPVESAGYIHLTLQAMAQFGLQIVSTPTGWHYESGSYRTPGSAAVEGDWSNAAFWLCAGAISSPVTVDGLTPSSAQGDRAILELLRRFGGDVRWQGNAVTVAPRPLRAIELDARDIPDLVPPLALVATHASGTTHIFGAARLRIKESDRLKSVADAINALGGLAQITSDGLAITGKPLTGGTVDSQNDHRIAMLAGIASALCPVHVCGAEAVNKSYPNFWKELSALQRRNAP